jgi:hypothetical protein
MTLNVVAKGLIMDKIELSMRYEEGNFEAANITEYLLRHQFVNAGMAFQVPRQRYPNNRLPPYAVCIPLCREHGQYLYVECGMARNRRGTQTAYVKFGFNPSRLLANEIAQSRFKRVLIDIIPSGGHLELLEDGKVLYAEFSADYWGIRSECIDAYSPRLGHSLYFPDSGATKTIVLHDDRAGRPEQICVYDKKASDWDRFRHLRRGMIVRVEAKRRFNRTPNTRGLRLRDLPGIENPFASVRIYDRELIASTFTAQRHATFLTQAQRQGVHAALTGTRGADRDRRERMLENCEVSWWNPEVVWTSALDAVNRVLQL